MENSKRCQERENQQVQSSPKSSSNSNSNNGGGGSLLPPLTPKTISRSEGTNNPCPTTFIQADTSSFKQVVQMLTGSTETKSKHLSSSSSSSPPPQSHHQPRPVPVPGPGPGPKKPAFKLYERRHNSFKKISPLVPGLFNPNHNSSSNPKPSFSPRHMPENLSPSILDLPSLVLSPVTPLSHDPFNRNSLSLSLSSTSLSPSPPGSSHRLSAEDRAIAEKGYYLHPSPMTSTPKDSDPPRLLPLFPVTTPSAKQ